MDKQINKRGSEMAHIINSGNYSSDFLKRFRHGSSNLQEYNKLMVDTAVEIAAKPLHESINDPIKQAFFMAQLQMTITHIQGERQHNILAAINPQLGSIRMKERLAYKSFWYEQSTTNNHQPFHIAMAVGLKFLNINPLACFTTIPVGTTQYSTFQPNMLLNERDIINQFNYGNEVYIKKGEDELRDYNGEIRGVVNFYTNNYQKIYVFENRISTYFGDFLCIGRGFLPNYPFGHEYLYQLPTLPCLIFANQDIGFEFRKIYREAGRIASSAFHALTFYGDMKNMSFSELAGRDIILICSPDKPEWDNINKVLREFHKYGVKSVAIYPFPIIGEFCHFGDRQISDEARNMLDQKMIDMSDYERVTMLAKHITDMAIPEDGLQDFIEEYNLDTNGKDNISRKEHKIEFSPWYILDNIDKNINGQIKTRHFFSPENTTLIYGPSDIGKSWFAMQIAISLATGREFFDQAASKPVKVFYLDGEVGNDFARRILQLSKGFDEHERALLNQNLLVRAFADSKELLERSEQILNVLKKAKPHVLLMDNILSLASQAWRGNSDRLFDFLRQIKAIGISPIIVHHTCKNGDTYLGSVSLESLSQNILRLEDARGSTFDMLDAEKSRFCVESETLFEAEADKGPFVRVCLLKTKVAPHWLKESILVWLPIDKSWRQLTKWPEVSCLAENKGEVDDVIDAAVEKEIVSLPPDERKVAQFIFSNPGGVKRKDLDEKFGWREQKSMQVINMLKDNGYVVSEGAGKGCIYKPKS